MKGKNEEFDLLSKAAEVLAPLKPFCQRCKQSLLNQIRKRNVLDVQKYCALKKQHESTFTKGCIYLIKNIQQIQ